MRMPIRGMIPYHTRRNLSTDVPGFAANMGGKQEVEHMLPDSIQTKSKGICIGLSEFI